MKITKRVLALVVAALMIFSTFAVAASAATSVQAMIDEAAAGSTVTLTKNSIGESITINKDITLDLGGKTFEGAPGKNAITINNANVKITNGVVIARFAKVDSWTMLKTVTEKSPTAIRVYGGEITLEGVRAVGSYTRVPTTTDDNLPTGTALAISNGANAILKQAALLGDYAINNKVTNAPAAGTVTVYDSLLGGWIMAVKGGINSVTVADGYTMNNLKDHVDGIFIDRPFTDKEKRLINLVLDSRFYFSLKDVDEKATVTVTGAEATVTAEEISYLWDNSTSTDCSYKYVPTYAVLADGTEIRLTKNGSEYTAAGIDAADAEDITIQYRVLYDMMPDAKLYFTNAEHYIAELYDKVFAAIDEAYKGYVDTYEEYVGMLADGNYLISEAQQDLATQFGADITDMVFDVQLALLHIGGQTMFKKEYLSDYADGYTGWGMDTWCYYFCENNKATNYTMADYPFLVDPSDPYFSDVLPDTGKYGVLDTIEELNAKLAECTPFSDQANWNAIATLIVDNYHDVLNLVDEAAAAITELKTALANVLGDETASAALEAVGLDEYAEIVDKLDGYIKMAQDALDEILAYDGVQDLFAKIDGNKELVPVYADKVAYAYNHIDQYISFDDIVAENRYLRTVFLEGETEVVYAAEPTNLDLVIAGLGSVNYTGVAPAVTAESKENIKFEETITLNAIPEEENEFLYWVNTETQRILSTEKELVLATSMDKFITAVFCEIGEQKIVFTNPTGDIAGEGYVGEGCVEIDAEEPYIAGFTFTGWPKANGNEIPMSAIDEATTDYYAGNSVFASSMAVYNSLGAIMKINPDTTSIIVTPMYRNTDTFTVTFKDGDASTSGTFNYNKTATATASGSNFSYWTDEEGRIVSVLPTYKYQVIKNSVFTAVYGAEEAVDKTINITLVKVADGKVSFSAERSVADGKTVLSSGVVFAYDTEKVPTVSDYDLKGTAKDNSNAGVYTAAVKEATIANNGGEIVAVPYLEVAGEGFIYGAPVLYPAVG